MANIKMILSYDGTKFLGWQKTKAGKSIEESLEKALRQVLQTDIELQAASRTDKGVHAIGQVAHFHLPNETICLKKLLHSLNALVGPQIAVKSLEKVADHFHPTLDNTGKEYNYYICTSPVQEPFFKDTSWHFPFPLDYEKMERAAFDLLGERDFAGFCNDRASFTRDTVCTIGKIEIKHLGSGRCCIILHGNRFLYKMVRNIVGALAYIGSGKMKESTMQTILKSKLRKEGAVTAPAHGLFLKQVFYK